ncbi:hypothetical protein [Plantactinospora sp. KLBMP9567]|uniref:HflX-like GTP-binding protein n=1 Tax=Plantactinospora sp. KLBMP9567 TaxID=3085900 RepID=UPI0029826372|nr:hypothetical protein [Plantactinospora sp. KLBMP9567]MDW5324130.1 hypothetical protein [Plantactinospora sp. KLBMP9567]
MAPIRTAVLVGLFSAKVRDHQDQFDDLEARLGALGVRVCGRFLQRRGVSDGGVRLLAAPLSRRFLIRSGKLAQVVEACETDDVDVVVFVNDLTNYQRACLSVRLGRPVLTRAEVTRSAPSLVLAGKRHRRPRRC